MTIKLSGFAFYPQRYDIDESNEMYSAGLTHGGKQCVVYIDPKTGSGIYPSIKLFAETGRRSANPCIAHPDNSPASPRGVFLVEQAYRKKDKAQFHAPDTVVYGCVWATVLSEDSPRHDSGCAPAAIELGYLEINFDRKIRPDLIPLFRQYQTLLQQASSATDKLQHKVELDTVAARIVAQRRKWFIACFLKPNEITTVSSKEELGHSLYAIFNKYTRNGLYGGCLIRVRGENGVYLNESLHCHHAFNYSLSRSNPNNLDPVRCFDKTINDFFNFNNIERLFSFAMQHNCIVELIPMQRLNCGNQGNQNFSADLDVIGSCKLLNCYVEKAAHTAIDKNFNDLNASLFSHIGCRLALTNVHTPTNKNYILSSINSFSAPIGNAYCIDNQGRAAFKKLISNQSQN